MSPRRAVFVDRDGVINELVADPESGLPESPLHADLVILCDGAAAALRRLADAGYLLIGVSNQPAAAKGIATLHELGEVQQRVLSLLRDQDVRFDAFRVCHHHPDGVVPELGKQCGCRKPAPGMILDAARATNVERAASWMVGDTDADVAAGIAAGCRTVLVENPGSAHKRSPSQEPDLVARSLEQAATLIIERFP